MLEIYLHQLHDHLKSLRFQLSLVLLVAFFAANGLVYGWKAERLVDEVGRVEAESARRYDGVSDLGGLLRASYRIHMRPLDTGFMVEGGQDWSADTVYLDIESGDGVARTGRVVAVNHWMDRFEIIDWALIVRIAVSFLAIALAYDTLSGERERGTLALLLIHPVSRARIVAAKLGAHLSALLAAVLVSAVLSLVILALQGGVQLSLPLLAPLALFLLGTTCYAAFFLLLAMAVSARARTSASALVTLMVIWAALVVVIPQAAYLAGARAVAAPDWNQVWDYWGEVRDNLNLEGLTPRGREEGAADDYAVEREVARRLNEAEKERGQLYEEARLREVRQFEVTRGLSLVSPGYAFQGTAEALLGTGLVRYRAFVKAAKEYVRTLRTYVRDLDAADGDSPHILYLPDYVSERPLDHRDIPRFGGVRVSLASAVAGSYLPISILLLETAAAFLLCLWAFRRAPVVDRD